jgi:hypothetical protein
MNHAQIAKICVEGKQPTYARILSDFRPQKEDLNRVHIATGSNITE